MVTYAVCSAEGFGEFGFGALGRRGRACSAGRSWRGRWTGRDDGHDAVAARSRVRGLKTSPADTGRGHVRVATGLLEIKSRCSAGEWDRIAVECEAHPVARLVWQDPFTRHSYIGRAGTPAMRGCWTISTASAACGDDAAGASVFGHMMRSRCALGVRARREVPAQLIDETAAQVRAAAHPVDRVRPPSRGRRIEGAEVRAGRRAGGAGPGRRFARRGRTRVRGHAGADGELLRPGNPRRQGEARRLPFRLRCRLVRLPVGACGASG